MSTAAPRWHPDPLEGCHTSGDPWGPDPPPRSVYLCKVAPNDVDGEWQAARILQVTEAAERTQLELQVEEAVLLPSSIIPANKQATFRADHSGLQTDSRRAARGCACLVVSTALDARTRCPAAPSGPPVLRGCTAPCSGNPHPSRERERYHAGEAARNAACMENGPAPTAGVLPVPKGTRAWKQGTSTRGAPIARALELLPCLLDRIEFAVVELLRDIDLNAN